MGDTREDIEQYGNGEDHWYYDSWCGFSGHWIDDWYNAEGSGPGERGVTGPRRATFSEALADVERLKVERDRHPFESWRVIKCSPSLKITIEKEIE